MDITARNGVGEDISSTEWGMGGYIGKEWGRGEYHSKEWGEVDVTSKEGGRGGCD